MDIKDIKDLIITMNKTNIEKIEIEKSDFRIMISKKASDESNTPGIITDGLGNSNILTKISDGGIREFEGKIDKECRYRWSADRHKRKECRSRWSPYH